MSKISFVLFQKVMYQRVIRLPSLLIIAKGVFKFKYDLSCFIWESQRASYSKDFDFKEAQQSFLYHKNWIMMIIKKKFACRSLDSIQNMYFTDWSVHDEFRNSNNLKRKSCSVVRQRGGRPYMHLIPDSSGMNRAHWRLGVVFCVLLMCLTVLITCSTALMSWVWWVHKQVPAPVISGLRLEAHAFENQQNRGAFFLSGGGEFSWTGSTCILHKGEHAE